MVLKETEKVLEKMGNALVKIYKQNLFEADAIASGELFQSIEKSITINGNNFTLSLSLEEYWKNIEYGRKAGKFPPINKIAEWIKIKPILPRPMANGKLPTAEQLTFLISRSIAENGIKPRPLLQDRVDNVNLVFWRDIEDAIVKDLGIQVEMIFKEIGL